MKRLFNYSIIVIFTLGLSLNIVAQNPKKAKKTLLKAYEKLDKKPQKTIKYLAKYEANSFLNKKQTNYLIPLKNICLLKLSINQQFIKSIDEQYILLEEADIIFQELSNNDKQVYTNLKIDSASFRNLRLQLDDLNRQEYCFPMPPLNFSLSKEQIVDTKRKIESCEKNSEIKEYLLEYLNLILLQKSGECEGVRVGLDYLQKVNDDLSNRTRQIINQLIQDKEHINNSITFLNINNSCREKINNWRSLYDCFIVGAIASEFNPRLVYRSYEMNMNNTALRKTKECIQDSIFRHFFLVYFQARLYLSKGQCSKASPLISDLIYTTWIHDLSSKQKEMLREYYQFQPSYLDELKSDYETSCANEYLVILDSSSTLLKKSVREWLLQIDDTIKNSLRPIFDVIPSDSVKYYFNEVIAKSERPYGIYIHVNPNIPITFNDLIDLYGVSDPIDRKFIFQTITFYNYNALKDGKSKKDYWELNINSKVLPQKSIFFLPNLAHMNLKAIPPTLYLKSDHILINTLEGTKVNVSKGY